MSTSDAHGVPAFTIRPLGRADHSIVITHMEMSAHMGTHVDAPRHFFPDGPTIDSYPLARFHGTGVVVDVRRRGMSAVHVDEIAAADIRKGDFVLFCFGYGELFGTPEYSDHPYLGDDVAEMLVDRGVSCVGVDVLTPDMPDSGRLGDFDWPVHHRLLANDVLIIENLGPNLVDLVGCRVAVSAPPLMIRGADGAPARVTATPLGAD